MFNQNPMAMPMMQFPPQNQNEMKREEIIRPYKEIIKQLETENERLTKENDQLKSQLKQYQMNNMGNQMNPMNNIGNMGMMNNQNNMMNQMNNIGMMNQMNNMGNMGMSNNQFNQFNMMNPMNNNIINSPMFQMCNQMNFDGNQMMLMRNESQKIVREVKFLSIKVKMEDGVEILIQKTSDDKMEEAISSFCCKAVLDKKDYDFFVITKHKAKFDSTIEENGIDTNDDYIFVKKKIVENDNSKGINDNNIQIKNFRENIIQAVPIIKGNAINLLFYATNGQKVVITVGLKNTFKDAAIAFCNKININPSLIGTHIIFLLLTEKLDLNDNKTLEQIGIRGNNIITVLDQMNIYGA